MIDENGWVQEKNALNLICPSEAHIENFIRDKNTNVINRRKTQRLDAGIGRIETRGTGKENTKDSRFRAQKAVEKLRREKQHKLAAFSLALDSEREQERSMLVPMAPPYQEVTRYLTATHATQKCKIEELRQSRLNIRNQKYRHSSVTGGEGRFSAEASNMIETPTQAAKTMRTNRQRPLSSTAGVGRKTLERHLNLSNKGRCTTPLKARLQSAQ